MASPSAMSTSECAWRRALLESLVGGGGACRLCLRPPPPRASVATDCSARDEYEMCHELGRGTVSLADMVETCSGIKLLATEAAGMRVCAACEAAARASYMFVLRCRQSEARLASLLHTLSEATATLTAPAHLRLSPPRTDALYLVLSARPGGRTRVRAVSVRGRGRGRGRGRAGSSTVQRLLETCASTPTKRVARRHDNVRSALIKCEATQQTDAAGEGSGNEGEASPDASDTGAATQCGVCGETCASRSLLRRHRRRQHGPARYECVVCGEACRSRRALREHTRQHRDATARFSCKSCSRSFTHASSLRKHTDTVHGEKKFACGECPKRFSQEARRAAHAREAHGGRRYVCADCGRIFNTKSSLRFHEESHRRKTCLRCGKAYKNKKSYLEHVRLCSTDAPTNLNTSRAAAAAAASRTAGVHHYVCDHCGKIFFRKQSLLIHVKTLHLHAKSFSCDTCGKKFRTKGQVKGHSIVHTRERNEKCHVCGRYFITKYALLYHTRLHTGERPYECELCGERFVSSSRRAAHRRVRHWGPAEECSVCFSKFYTKYSLRVHTRRHYNPTSKLYAAPPPPSPPPPPPAVQVHP